MIHGIIDIGSNTVRMAIYKVEHGKLEMLMKKKYPVGLAAYIKGNRMQQEGIDKTCEVLTEFKVFLETFHITNVAAFTTAALRNVDNSEEAVREIVDRTGIDIQVISGDEEATFDFIGATHAAQIDEGILIDIGGASTEIVVYKDGKMLQMASLPIGSLAMHTKFVEGLLPGKAEEEEIRRAVLLSLQESGLSADDCGNCICGIGGTFKGAAKLNSELFKLPADHKEISVEKIEEMIRYFECDSNLVSTDLLDVLIKVVPDRIKTILPGLIIADTLASYFGSKIIIYSDSGVREGYLYDKVIKARK